jgi:hypothetical protein
MHRASKQKMNTVKLRVRKNALALRTFTIEEMVKVTGLNPESVRTEVQRMRRDGFLVSETLGGKVAKLYRLTSDPKKRLQLSEEIDAFYPEPVAEIAPTSFHYRRAVALLDEAMSHPRLARADQHKMLTTAREELEFAKEDEGDATETVEAFIECQLARLLYLEGQIDDAAEVLERARAKFKTAGLRDEVSKADQLLLSIMIERVWAGLGPVTIETKTRTAVDTIRANQTSWADQPLVSLLVDLSTKLLKRLKYYSSQRTAIESQIDPADRAPTIYLGVPGSQVHSRGYQVQQVVRGAHVQFKIKDLGETSPQSGDVKISGTIDKLRAQKVQKAKIGSAR